MSHDGKTIDIYTDGASGNRTGKDGGIAALILYDNNTYQIQQGYTNTSNCRMELRAALAALQAITKPKYRVRLFSDAQYVVHPFTKGYIYTWAEDGFIGRKNADLWQAFFNETKRFSNLSFIWIRGHNGNKYNERCDSLAKQAIKMPNKLKDLP